MDFEARAARHPAPRTDRGPDLQPFLVERLERLRSRLAELDLEALLVVQGANRRWLTGFTGTFGYALVPRDGAPVFFTDWRYTEQAATECVGFEIDELFADKRLWGPLGDRLAAMGIGRLGFEAAHTNVAMYESALAEVAGVDWQPTRGIVEGLRQIKDAYEIDRLRVSQRITEAVFAETLPRIQPGVRERDLAVFMRSRIEQLGATNNPTFPIVASGWRAALPHGRASEKRVERGEFLLFDFGSVVDGYYSDMTRTVVVGKADARQRDIYQRVRDVEQAAAAMMRAGTSGRAVDRAARDPLTRAGYSGKQAHGYSVGHGVGLEIHEDPFMSEGYEAPLQHGMVVTIEPGIYISGWGGVRIEDIVHVTNDGPEVLTDFTHELLEL